MAKKQLTWTNERRKLRDLTPWEHNPRYIKDKQAERLLESFNEFGQVLPICIDGKGSILDGHQRRSVIGAADEYGLDYEVDVRVANRELTERERQKLTVYLHQGAQGSWDFEALANTFDFDDLVLWGFDEDMLTGMEFAKDETDDDNKAKISRTGRLYNAGDGHDVEPFKLAYRIEAIWRSNGDKAIDLFSGTGQLAAWYKRRFKTVITVDKAFQQGDVDYSMTAAKFIEKHLSEHLDFDYIDFDDEGCPGKEIQDLFSVISGKKKSSFVLALTDGNGMNLKFRGRSDLSDLYLVDGETMRQMTRSDYDGFEDIVTEFMHKVANRAGFNAAALSSYRGRDGNVLFQTWLITCAD